MSQPTTSDATDRPRSPVIIELIDAFHSRTPIRAWSLIVTVYGDAIVPRGGTLWLGTLITLMDAFGIGSGLVRTAGSRLAADDWLTRTRIGRKSYYRLSSRGRDDFVAATERIYNAPKSTWSGSFHVAILGETGDPQRNAMRRPLEEAGYGHLAPSIMIAPDDKPGPDLQGVSAIGLSAATIVPDDAHRLVSRAWPVDQIGERYERFRARFAELDKAIARGADFSPLESLIARILMIHEFRRIILRDPELPAELLPEDWPGVAARAMSGRIYRALLGASESWLDEHASCEDGPLPAPHPVFFARFA